MAGLMMIHVNGKQRPLEPGTTLASLVAATAADPARIVAELDGRIVSRDAWTATRLHDGAVVELVTFVGGG